MHKQELKVAKDIARKAGAVMLEYFEGEQGLEHKLDTPEATEVTIADKQINSMVIEELGKSLGDSVIGEEESNSEYGPGRKWLCDPIDGTRAFVIGVPTAMFSLALIIDGAPVLGVAYDPFHDKLFWAIKGQGSYCNGLRLSVSKDGIKGQYVELSSSLDKIIERPEPIRRLVALGAKPNSIYGAVFKSCLIAQGRIVGYFEKGVNPHDVAAVHVILEEAGGKVTGYKGEKLDYSKYFRGAVLSNGVVHADLLKCVQE